MPTLHSKRSTGVRIDSREKLCSTTMLVLLAHVFSSTRERQTNYYFLNQKTIKRETRHTERQCPARTWTNFLPEKHLRLFRHFFRSWQATARPPKPFLPFGVCLNSPGERHLATSSHALNTAKIEQRVPKLPVRLQMSESNRLGAGT